MFAVTDIIMLFPGFYKGGGGFLRIFERKRHIALGGEEKLGNLERLKSRVEFAIIMSAESTALRFIPAAAAAQFHKNGPKEPFL